MDHKLGENKFSPALRFNLIACEGKARACLLELPHGNICTPVFMPVGTKGTIKGISSKQLEDASMAPEIILGNTYHLALQPGTDIIASFGGLHKFMNWKRNLLTDSGGFQMVSLLKLAEVGKIFICDLFVHSFKPLFRR